jgi:hypothetical protein
MYDALFPEQTEKSLLTSVPTRPQPRGIWGNLGGALKAIAPVAVAETARAVDAFRGAVGLSGGDSVESMQAGMPSLSTSIGRDIKRITPDPETTGEASNIVFGFSKIIAKALPLGVVGGLPAAAVGTGFIEGTADALRLQDEGVDAKTAAKVGAIKGVATGVGIALPIAGKTLGQTAALVLGGGPASFMAEQQASKLILDSADYGAIARQYNPFDPVGLTISALVPGAVAGVVHTGRARGARTAAAQASEAARVAQENLVANQRILDEAAAASAAQRDAMAVSRADAEAAARALQMAEHIRNTGLRPEGDLAGAAIHVDAIEQARRALDAGEPVNAAAVVRQAIDEQAARLSAEEKPGFLRTADEMVAARQAEYPMLTPEIGRAFEIIQQPAFLRTAADRIFLERMLEPEKAPAAAQPVAPEPKAGIQPPQSDSAPAIFPHETTVKTSDNQVLEHNVLAAREVAKAQPDLLVPDETTGTQVKASELVKKADDDFARESNDAAAYLAAAACGMRH